MRFDNGQIKDMNAGTETTDGASWGQSAKFYRSGALKLGPKMYSNSAVVSGGNITFYLTDNGLASGNPIFTNVYKETMNWWIDDANNQYQLGGYILSGDLKSITLNVNRLGSVLLGIIQFIGAANGATVHLVVWGD